MQGTFPYILYLNEKKNSQRFGLVDLAWNTPYVDRYNGI